GPAAPAPSRRGRTAGSLNSRFASSSRISQSGLVAAWNSGPPLLAQLACTAFGVMLRQRFRHGNGPGRRDAAWKPLAFRTAERAAAIVTREIGPIAFSKHVEQVHPHNAPQDPSGTRGLEPLCPARSRLSTLDKQIQRHASSPWSLRPIPPES